ncbi:hypothetical protein MTR_2g038905 [Medicago truncatula]|uniref:Uncharacterized protein n=1 Tax=Medicago truncatula TaxID=3880 RepID=A0A072VH54_MEDTR|nr:hypothetical protein MTR_2g038905 [Medicago truncatula]
MEVCQQPKKPFSREMLYLLLNSLNWSFPTNTALYDKHIEDFDVDSSSSEELKRKSSGNTFKLNIESCGPGLQPTYGRYYVCFDGRKKAINLYNLYRIGWLPLEE